MAKYIDADALMNSMNSFIESMTSCGIVVDGEMLWDKLNDVVDKEPEASLIGIVQTAHGITFTATGTAAQGQERGFALGKALMYERLSKELMYAGLFTDAVKSVFEKIYLETNGESINYGAKEEKEET